MIVLKSKIDKLQFQKTFKLYMSKKPIVGMIDGEAYDIIKNSNCGLISRSGEHKKLSFNIKKILKFSKSKKLTLGNNVFILQKTLIELSNLKKQNSI